MSKLSFETKARKNGDSKPQLDFYTSISVTLNVNKTLHRSSEHNPPTPPKHTLPSGVHLNCLCMAGRVFASNSNESLHTQLPFRRLGL